MTARSTAHATFVIERDLPAPPARVFHAFADPGEKAAWSCHDNWASLEMDFRPGGREVTRGGPPGGPIYTFNGLYQDIVPNERIVFSYGMDRDETRISASVAVIEFRPTADGTHLTFTEHGVFLDGHDDPAGREHGSAIGLDHLAEHLRREPAGA